MWHLPVGPTQRRDYTESERERGVDVQRENDMSGVLNGGNSSGLVASSVLSDTASAGALRACVCLDCVSAI